MSNQNIPQENTATWLDTNCGVCGGSGMVHPRIGGIVDYSRVEICECIRQKTMDKRKELLLKSCDLPPYAENMDFESFTVYPEVKSAYDDAMTMAAHSGELAWLALIGGNGTGKTHLAVAVCKTWINKGVAARYALTSLLLDELREGFRKRDDESYDSRFAYYCNIPLLLLDDCGIESKTGWVQEKLETLVDYRLMHNLSLIVTSNQSLDEMPARIASRLVRHPKGKVVSIMAKDYGLRSQK